MSSEKLNEKSPKKKSRRKRTTDNLTSRIVWTIVNKYINEKVPTVEVWLFHEWTHYNNKKDQEPINAFLNQNFENAPVIDVGAFKTQRKPKKTSKLDVSTYDNEIFQDFFQKKQDGVIYSTEDTDKLLIEKGQKMPAIEGCYEIKSYQDFLDLNKPESFALICKDGKCYIWETIAVKQQITQTSQKQKIAINI